MAKLTRRIEELETKVNIAIALLVVAVVVVGWLAI